MLRPIPSSKSDIFKDKALGLGDKRSLMGFLGAAVEAVQGGGRLKVNAVVEAMRFRAEGVFR